MVKSDWVEMEIAAGIELEVRFFHCNPRHHSVALAKAPFELPATLHHLMVETNCRDDVGAAFDRAWATDLDIPNGLGLHDTTSCSASTRPVRPGSWSRSAMAPGRSPTTGTATTATTGPACGVINRFALPERHPLPEGDLL